MKNYRRSRIVLLFLCLAAVGCQKTAETKSAQPAAASAESEASDLEAATSDEHLGPRDGGTAVTGTHPVEILMYAQRSQPREELRGKHPSILVDEAGLEPLRNRAKTTHKDKWSRVLKNLRALTTEPPAAPAQGRRSQNVVGIGIAEVALAWAVERDPKYLKAAKKWMDAATSYEVWGYTYNKPDVDLAAGHLLYGMGVGYDLLYNDLTEEERKRYRDKMVRQAKLMAEHFEPKGGRTFAYSQNHVYIPAVGLGFTAYALYDEVPEAERWARLSRVIVGRSLDTYSADGYFYESFEYFVFAVPWLVHYVSAHEQVTGEALWDRPGFRHMHEYLAHIVLPSGKDVFDFGDAFSGSDTRLRKIDDVKRTHPGDKLHSNYNILFAMARWFESPGAQGVANEMARRGDVSWYDYMSLIWFDPAVKPSPASKLPLAHHFEDHGVVFSRDSWSSDATAVAFKAGPPEGHSTLAKQRVMPDWHLSSGHAHPDANSFIIYANGEYLSGDSGYSGVPRSDQHNTVLVDGMGQRSVPAGHNSFYGIPYDRLDQIKLTVRSLAPGAIEVEGQAAAAYNEELGVEEFRRVFKQVGPKEFEVQDTLKASKATVFAALVHSDDRLDEKSEGKFVVASGDAELAVEVSSESKLKTEVEPNWMTGPGRPGSVQKGEREARGKRLRISNEEAAKAFSLHTRLSVQ